jgi:excisionase family DNA binding protein
MNTTTAVVEHGVDRVAHTGWMRRDSVARRSPNRDAEDAAERLGVSSRTVRRLATRGELASHRIANLLRFSDVDIDDYIHRARKDAVTRDGFIGGWVWELPGEHASLVEAFTADGTVATPAPARAEAQLFIPSTMAIFDAGSA